MPSREEIVDRINKAADIFEMIGIEFLGEKVLKDYADKMRMSAAQVEAMRCENCARYDMPYGWCNRFDLAIDKDFGCFHHEKKNPPVKAGLPLLILHASPGTSTPPLGLPILQWQL